MQSSPLCASGYSLECRVSHKLLKRYSTLIICLLFCSPAWAHSGLVGMRAVWDGALHVLATPLSLAALVGACTVLTGAHERYVLALSLCAAVFAALAFLISSYLPACTVPALVAILGLVGVGAWRLSTGQYFVVAIVAGLAGGLAADVDAPSSLTIVGVFLAEISVLFGLLIAYQDLASVQKLATVLPIAKRVLGSWIAAMGLLMTALVLYAN